MQARRSGPPARTVRLPRKARAARCRKFQIDRERTRPNKPKEYPFRKLCLSEPFFMLSSTWSGESYCRCAVVSCQFPAGSIDEVLSAACMKSVVACVHPDDHAVASATRLGRVERPAVTAIWAVSFWNSARPRPCASFPACLEMPYTLACSRCIEQLPCCKPAWSRMGLPRRVTVAPEGLCCNPRGRSGSR